MKMHINNKKQLLLKPGILKRWLQFHCGRKKTWTQIRNIHFFIYSAKGLCFKTVDVVTHNSFPLYVASEGRISLGLFRHLKKLCTFIISVKENNKKKNILKLSPSLY
jgi:hypothetical protein